MRFDTYSFPHPVLGRGDDIDGDPDFTAEIEDEDDEKFVVSLQYRVDNHDIECLIAEGKATVNKVFALTQMPSPPLTDVKKS